MADYCVLYNPKSGNGKEINNVHNLSKVLPDDNLHYVDITTIENLTAFIDSVDTNERLVIAGGDGTINRFINTVDPDTLSKDIYYYGMGSGNDFQHDIGVSKGAAPILINDYIKNLPVLYVNGREFKFLNGIGFGIDGYCCEEADKIRRRSPSKKTNYTLLALKGLLGGYKPRNAEVIVDGVSHSFKKVWMVPTMNGRYFGGGFMPTPAQDRLNVNRSLSVESIDGLGILRGLTLFLKVYKGTHVKYTKYVHIMEGHDITVKFDRPCALQVDGEVVFDVSEYHVVSKVPAVVM